VINLFLYIGNYGGGNGKEKKKRQIILMGKFQLYGKTSKYIHVKLFKALYYGWMYTL